MYCKAELVQSQEQSSSSSSLDLDFSQDNEYYSSYQSSDVAFQLEKIQERFKMSYSSDRSSGSSKLDWLDKLTMSYIQVCDIYSIV